MQINKSAIEKRVHVESDAEMHRLNIRYSIANKLNFTQQPEERAFYFIMKLCRCHLPIFTENTVFVRHHAIDHYASA